MLSATQIDRKIELAQLEERVEKGLQGFYKAGQAWSLIKEKQLYPQESFKAYLQERWGITVRHADRLMSAFTIVSELKETFKERPIGLSLPDRESQVRPLAQLPSEQRPTAWETAIATSDREVPTAAEVSAAVEAVAAQPETEWSQRRLSRSLQARTRGSRSRLLRPILQNRWSFVKHPTEAVKAISRPSSQATHLRQW